MDIPALSMAMASIKTASEVSVAVLGNAMDQQEIQGAGIVKMIDSAAMEGSVNPDLGGNIDVRI
ncbi:MAG: YjfB family protein [Lachnospiraceae bacterium]|nr:YjfB family protein [Lachnospiraceae bacterium]